MDVYAYFAEQIPKVDRVLDEVIPAADTEPAPLHAAMRHILFPGGKRLRPVQEAPVERAGRQPQSVHRAQPKRRLDVERHESTGRVVGHARRARTGLET